MTIPFDPENRIQLHDLRFLPSISAQEVQTRVHALGAALQNSLSDDTPLFISVLSGSFIFTADLVRAFEHPCEITFVKLTSYAGTQSTGDVQTVMGLEKDVSGRHLVVVEDIVDTGRTLHFFLEQLWAQQPASVTTVGFLRKPDAAKFSVKIDLVGFDIEDNFVVGYGLDYNGLGRNLKGIYVLEPTTHQ
jgi:hypoxanthine phosphoribosyltransferase